MPIITLKSNREIKRYDKCANIVLNILDSLSSHLQNSTTQQINDFIIEKMKGHGVSSAFLSYCDYPKETCISVNEELVHGLPSDRVLVEGDIVSIDVGIIDSEGYIGDCCRTFCVGNVKPKIARLVENTEKGLWAGIEACKEGNYLYDINEAIWNVAKENKYGVAEHYCGHSVDKFILHSAPRVYNYVNREETNIKLRNGIILCLEPMFSIGKYRETKVEENEWTVHMIDDAICCHCELMVCVDGKSPRVLGQ